MQSKTLIVVPNGKVWASRQQADTIETLALTRKGGFTRIYGYRPSSNWVVSPVQDIVGITRISTAKVYERKRTALESIAFNDIADAIKASPKLSALTRSAQVELFTTRLSKELQSLNTSLDGVREDAHRKGHDRCYLNLADGVKVNYVTEKGADGLMYPVITDGFPTVASIMLTYLENSKVTRVAGERKVVNSGVDKLMSNAINSVLNSKSVGIKTASLKEDNFERIVIDKEVIVCEDVVGLVY